MTIFRPERSSAPPAADSSAARIGYLLFVAWSGSRGSWSMQKAASSFLQNAMILAIGFCFPVGHGRRRSIGWGSGPLVIPSLSRAPRMLDR